MEIIIRPSMTIDDAYNELQNAARENGCVCWCDFNGKIISSDETLDDAYKKLFGDSELENAELTLNEYQRRAMTTCLPSSRNDCYMLFGLVEEVGELCGKVSKAIRKEHATIEESRIQQVTKDNKVFEGLLGDIMLEAGDVLWMLAGLCHSLGCSLEDIARFNLDKLAKRKEQGTIVTHTDH